MKRLVDKIRKQDVKMAKAKSKYEKEKEKLMDLLREHQEICASRTVFEP